MCITTIEIKVSVWIDQIDFPTKAKSNNSTTWWMIHFPFTPDLSVPFCFIWAFTNLKHLLTMARNQQSAGQVIRQWDPDLSRCGPRIAANCSSAANQRVPLDLRSLKAASWQTSVCMRTLRPGCGGRMRHHVWGDKASRRQHFTYLLLLVLLSQEWVSNLQLYIFFFSRKRQRLTIIE